MIVGHRNGSPPNLDSKRREIFYEWERKNGWRVKRREGKWMEKKELKK